MITLVLPLMIERIIEATKIFGGTEGISGLSSLAGPKVEFLVAMVAVWAVLFAARRLIASDYGLILIGIRDNDRSVMSGGINIYIYKAQALFLAGSIGAFAGAIMTHAYMFVGMPVFALGLFDHAHCRRSRGGHGNHGRSNAGGLLSWCPCRSCFAVWAACASSFMRCCWVIFTVGVAGGYFSFR